MPAATKRKSTVTRKRRYAQPARRLARAHLLVIECDSEKLARDAMNLGTPFGELVKGLFPNKRIAVVQTSTEKKLREDLANVFQEYGRFRSILIVGHSDAGGLKLTAEPLRSWDIVGKWLSLFEPEFLFLAACDAGRSVAVRELFASVGSLRQIYASPVTMYKIHTAPMGVLLCMLLANGKINPAQSQAMRTAHYILTGGQLFRWLRSESGPGEELRGPLLGRHRPCVQLRSVEFALIVWSTYKCSISQSRSRSYAR
jgi:hypothetical protein